GADPLMTVACSWLWLLLVPLAGVASVRVAAGSAPETLTLVNLAMIPGSPTFVGLWLGGLALNARGLLFGVIPVGVGVALSGLATWRVRLKAPTLAFPKWGGKIKAPIVPALPTMPPWGRFVLWGAFAVAVYNVLTRP